MEFRPHKYQAYCISRILDTPRIGLFLGMGMGKTAITLSAVAELRLSRFEVRKVLVIAPKKVAEGTWTREKDKWDHTRALRVSPVLGSQTKRIRALNTPADVYITNRESVCWLVDYYRNDWPFDMVVIDESSSFKSHSAKRFKSLAAISPKISRLVELTGTPSPNSLQDLWAQVYLLDGGERLGKRVTHFRERFFVPGRRGPGGMAYDYKPKEDARDVVLEKISDICISLRPEDYLELPEMVYHTFPVALDAKAERAYREMEIEMVLALPDGEISVTSAAALSGKLLQLSNGAVYDEAGMAKEIHKCKLEAFLEMLESLQGESVLVFYGFRHDRDRILRALEKSGLRVRELKWPKDEDDWNAGRIDVLLAHPASCAYGLNLQRGGHHVIWFGLTWNCELYSQANKRLHRQGQQMPVYVHHLVCTGTRDEDVIAALDEKENAQNYVLEALKVRIEKIKKEVKKC